MRGINLTRLRGRAIEWYQSNFTTTDPGCYGNGIWDKIGHNSARVKISRCLLRLVGVFVGGLLNDVRQILHREIVFLAGRAGSEKNVPVDNSTRPFVLIAIDVLCTTSYWLPIIVTFAIGRTVYPQYICDGPHRNQSKVGNYELHLAPVRTVRCFVTSLCISCLVGPNPPSWPNKISRLSSNPSFFTLTHFCL